MLTDSGGFQVFSLNPKVDDDGVNFSSVYDGAKHRFTPEDAVRVQEQIGADIAMVLDVCAPLPSPPHVIRQAVERTAAWAARQRKIHQRPDQVQFGIVQGGIDEAMRRESASRTVEIGFDGYAIGGLSVGESKAEMYPAIEAANSVLPKDRPRYLMGVGDPVSLIEGVARGVDMFDCVLPTRNGRNANAFTAAGQIRLRNAKYAEDDLPIEPGCDCPACNPASHGWLTCQGGTFSRAYLRHLFYSEEMLGPILVTLHNLRHFQRFMADLRGTIQRGDWSGFWVRWPVAGPKATSTQD